MNETLSTENLERVYKDLELSVRVHTAASALMLREISELAMQGVYTPDVLVREMQAQSTRNLLWKQVGTLLRDMDLSARWNVATPVRKTHVNDAGHTLVEGVQGGGRW